MNGKLILSFSGVITLITVALFSSNDLKTSAPDITRMNAHLVDIHNHPIDLLQFRGKVVFINNWASWCPPCIAEIPSILKLKNELGSEDFVFLMVSFDEDRSKATAYMKKKGYNLEVYFPGDKYPYRTESIPVTYILGKDGKVAGDHGGMTDYSTKEIVDFMKSLGR